MRSDFNVIAFGLAVASFAAYQQFKLPVVLPVLLDHYHYDRFLAGSFMSVYALIGLLLSLKLGSLIKRRGVVALIQVGLALFVGGAALTLAVPEFGWVVLFARSLEGLGFAIMAIGGPVLANSNAAPRHLPIVVGLTATWIPVGQLIAAVLAPLALASLGWQLLWWISIAGSFAFAAWAASLRRLDHSSTARGTPAEPQSGSRDKAPPPVAMTPAQRRVLVTNGAIFMFWSCQYFAYMTWLPQYLVEVHALELSDALLGYVVPVSLVIVCSTITGFLLRAGLSLGWLMSVALFAQVVVWWTMPWIHSPGLGLLSLVVYGSAGGVIPSCLFAAPSRAMQSGRNTAQAFGIVMTGRNMGVLVGPVLLAQAYKLTGVWDHASLIFGAVTALCLPLALVLAVKLPGRKLVAKSAKRGRLG
jgi:MFS family permease